MSRGSPYSGDDPHGEEPVVTAGTAVGDADAALVLVHGRGATARSVLQLGEQLAGDRDVALLAPQAAANTGIRTRFSRRSRRTSRAEAPDSAPSTARLTGRSTPESTPNTC